MHKGGKQRKTVFRVEKTFAAKRIPGKNVNSAIDKARKVPRAVALRKVSKTVKSEGPIFAVTYDPRLPELGQIQTKHWRSMTSRNKYLGDVFKRPPMIAYKRQPNLREHLIKAKVPKAPRLHQERRQNGMKRCGSGCLACPYIKETKSVTINGINWKINRNLSCKSFNVRLEDF